MRMRLAIAGMYGLLVLAFALAVLSLPISLLSGALRKGTAAITRASDRLLEWGKSEVRA